MRLTPAQWFTVSVTILAAVLSVAGHVAVREWYKPDLRYEEGAWYISSDRAVVSLRVSNVGRADAEELRIRVTFDLEIKDTTTNDRPFDVSEGGIGAKHVVGTVSRLVPGESLQMYFATLAPETGEPDRSFVSSIMFQGGMATAASESSEIRSLLLISVIALLVGLGASTRVLFLFVTRASLRKQRQTMADIRSIAVAVESYSIDHDQYPVATTIKELAALVEPDYIRDIPTTDGWGRPFQIKSTRRKYMIHSYGRNGVRDAAPGGAQGSLDADIIFSDGQFVQWPEGLQE